MKVHISFDAQPVIALMGGLSKAAKDLSPVMKDTEQDLRESVRKNFRSESSRTPHASHIEPAGFWADLKESTKRARERKGQVPITKLKASGRLLNSLQTGSEALRVQIGTSVPYARHLQHGTRKMPARPFLALQESDVKKLKLRLESHFARAFNQSAKDFIKRG